MSTLKLPPLPKASRSHRAAVPAGRPGPPHPRLWDRSVQDASFCSVCLTEEAEAARPRRPHAPLSPAAASLIL